MIRLISVALIFLLVSACASTKSIGLDAGFNNRFAGKSLAVTKRKQPSFTAFTNASLLLGVPGAAIAVASGSKIVKNHDLSDPSAYIANVLSEDFAAEFNANLVEKNEDILPVEGKVINDIISQYSDVDYLLDVRTVSWVIVPFALSPKYNVVHKAKLRFIDVKQGAVIAEGLCNFPSKKTAESSTFKKLLEDKAFLLRLELNIIGNKCINKFKKDVLNLPETPLEVITLAAE